MEVDMVKIETDRLILRDYKETDLLSTSDWKKKLDIFISDFEYAADVVGILVCGSYITGSPTKHSDLDVHLVLNNAVGYRERGNKIIDGLLIEYFANPPKQILRYFDEDFRESSLMAQTQFATGEILLDKTGEVAELKEKAEAMITDFYSAKRDNFPVSDLDKYGLWDMLDDLQDAHENNRVDFDFLYFTCLNRLIENYMRIISLPYNTKTIYGNIADAETRKKYLLQELPNSDIKNMIVKAIVAAHKNDKLSAYEKLTTAITNNFGGFNIDGFKFKSNVEE
jgi:hypothetical protein